MGYCFMMGEAAGLAAAIAVKNNTDTALLNASDVQAELFKNGIPTV
jgi:hypothetical protein